MPLFLAPNLLTPPSGAIVPAGVIVGFVGTNAEIAAVDDWQLADGTNGTPDLSNKMVRSAGTNNAFNATGGYAGTVTLTTSTEGDHSNNVNGAGPGGGSALRANNINGAHAHTGSDAFDNTPPCYDLAFIISTQETELPNGAIIWFDGGSAPSGYVTFSGLVGRYARAKNDDTRGAQGALTKSLTMTLGSAGNHSHWSSAGQANGSDDNYFPFAGGPHVHDISGDVTMNVPSFLVMLPIQRNGGGLGEGLCLLFNGASAPAKWALCDGVNGRPNLFDRFPRGADVGNGLNVGTTGGVDIAATVLDGSFTGSVSTFSGSHGHNRNDQNVNNNGGGSSHYPLAWVHNHASVAVDQITHPPYHTLNYIIYTG